MSFDDAIKLFKELGFPAAVAIFVLWRLEARLKELVGALTGVQAALSTLIHIGDDAKRALQQPPKL